VTSTRFRAGLRSFSPTPRRTSLESSRRTDTRNGRRSSGPLLPRRMRSPQYSTGTRSQRRHPTFPTALPICGLAADTPVRARSIGGQTTAGPRLTASHPTAASSCRIASKRSGARAVGGSSEAWGPHRPPPGLVTHPRIRRDDRHRSRPQLIQRAVTTSTVPPAEQRQPAHALRNSAGSPPATTPQAARPAQS